MTLRLRFWLRAMELTSSVFGFGCRQAKLTMRLSQKGTDESHCRIPVKSGYT